MATDRAGSQLETADKSENDWTEETASTAYEPARCRGNRSSSLRCALARSCYILSQRRIDVSACCFRDRRRLRHGQTNGSATSDMERKRTSGHTPQTAWPVG